jgi:hypothetical protein
VHGLRAVGRPARSVIAGVVLVPVTALMALPRLTQALLVSR